MAETFITLYQGAGGRVDVGYDYTQNISTNKTSLTVKAYVVKTNSSYYSARQQPQTFTLTVNGTATTYGWTFDFRNMNLNQRYLITTATREISHNADGTKSNVTASVYCSTGTEGLGVVSGNTSIAIATIPRASTPTLSASSTAIGSKVVISTNRASSSFTHTITYSFGSASGTIATGVGTSHEWTLPTSLANQIPNTTSGSGSIKLKTYSGSTLIGEKSIAFKATVPNTSAFQPTASGLSASISGTGRDKTIGKYVQSISKVYMSFSSSANGGATITSNSINIKKGTSTNSMTVSGKSGTSGTLTSGGVYTITATTTDSRGRSKSTSIEITVQAYAVPKISSFTATRQSTTKTSVSTARNGTYTYMSGSNPLTVVIARRPRGGSYTNLNTSAGTTSGTFSGTYTSTSNSETTSYDFRLTISDSFGNSAVSEITVPTSSVALSIAGDTGIGVGKIHEQGALDVAGSSYFNGVVNFNSGSAVRQVNMGSLYIASSSNTGAIWIDIGTSNVMFNLKVNIRSYSYLANIQAGGYTYTSTANWHSTHATGQISGGNLNVRFATASTSNGSKRYIVIGDSSTSWGGYLHVTVDDVTVGYGGRFGSPFVISLVTSYPANISNTINVGSSSVSWGSVTGKPSTFPPSSHTHAYVPTSRTVNGKALSANISLSASDVGAASSSHSHAYLPTSEVATGKTGTITNATWSSISFGKTFSSAPKVVVTGANSVTGESFGKVRNVSTTGFEIVVGGTGTSNAFNWIAIK